MGKLANIGVSRLDVLIQEHSPAGLLELITSRVAEEESLADVARSLAVPYSVLWRWLSATPEGEADRMGAYRLALEARADALAHESLADINGAGPDKDEIALAKLRAEHRLKLAAKWDRRTYGEGKDAGAAGITVVVQRGAGPVTIEDGRGGVLRVGADGGEGDPAGYAAAGEALEGEVGDG